MILGIEGDLMLFVYGRLRIYKLKGKKKTLLGNRKYEWEQARITIRMRDLRWNDRDHKLRELDGKDIGVLMIRADEEKVDKKTVGKIISKLGELVEKLQAEMNSNELTYSWIAYLIAETMLD